MSANACDVLSDSGKISNFIAELNELKKKTEDVTKELECLYRTMLADDSWKENGKKDLLKALGMVTQYGNFLADAGTYISLDDSSGNFFGSYSEIDGHFTRCLKTLELFESDINSLDDHSADCMMYIKTI